MGILDGKVAVITGAGSGVGRAMSNLFAENGASVLVVDVVPDRVEQVVKEARARSQAKVEGMTLDLSLRESPDLMVDRAAKVFGRVDILCNNAGIMDGVRPVVDTPDGVWEKVMDINVNAPFRASRRAIPLMQTSGGGSIINTASVAGLFGGVAGAAYTTSKHALIGLTRSIAAHYRSAGIRCNAMVLGAVNTNIGVGATAPDPKGMEHLMKAMATLPRTGEPGEIAELALFLASDRSKLLNGSCIVIDGGWTLL
ncbi:MAG: SDR family oxidoreductase [Nitrososphaerota archaeon]|nr:SDR family oxidoreductase [Nitrososphaerota archaeon]